MELTDDDVIGTGKYIKADELANVGTSTVTIKGVRRDTFQDGSEKEVLHFHDGRAVTLNATRKAQLQEAFGYPLKVSSMRDKDVELYTEKVNNPKGGAKVNSVQIRAAKTAF